MIGKIFINIGLKLLTEKFVIAAILLGLEFLVKKTDNKLDDALLNSVKEALNG